MKTEVGIPVYNAVDTLPRTLESLINQTTSNFGICLSIDGDGHLNEYLDIINDFTARGLNIRTIYSNINCGPGMARQRILDTTEAEYLIFLDSDDLLTPRAVEILTYVIEHQELDVVRAAYVREERGGPGSIIPQNSASITHFHGKIYRLSYLREKNINFHPDLRLNEDSYFNLIAWNSTDKRGELAEPMCIWRENEHSITRGEGEKAFFIKSYDQYILSQVDGLKKLHEVNGGEVSLTLITTTLVLIYTNYMRAKCYGLDLEKIDAIISTLQKHQFMQDYLNDYHSWVELVKQLRVGEIYDDIIVFYKEPFSEWANRLLKEKKDAESDQ